MTMEKKERTICRNVGPIEFRGIINNTIPVCDEFGEFNEQGLALVEKNGKIGVVNKKPKVIVPIEQENVEFLENGFILTLRGGEYYLYTDDGFEIVQPRLTSKVQALTFALKL